MDGAAQIVVLVPAIAVAYVRYLQRLGIVDQNIKIVLSPEEDMLTTEVEE